MTDPKGPIEVALSGPGFRNFWQQYISDLGKFRDSLLVSAMKCIRDGDDNQALTYLKRSVSVDDVIERTRNAPENMIRHEKGDTNDSLTRSDEAGYSGIG